MSDATVNLNLPYIMAAQAEKHVTHNESLKALDALVQITAASRTLSTPPGDPSEGQRYIVAGGGTDDWSGQDGNLAAYQDGLWVFYEPVSGWTAWIEDERRHVTFDGGSWQEPEIATANGAFTRLRTIEEEISVSGPNTAANTKIPNRAIVLGVSVYDTALISGATAFDVGTSDEPSKFGGSLGINQGDTNVGVIGPTAYYADTPIQLSAIGGDFTGGTVRLVLHVIECGPALS